MVAFAFVFFYRKGQDLFSNTICHFFFFRAGHSQWLLLTVVAASIFS